MSVARFWAAVRRFKKMTPQVWSSYDRTYVDVRPPKKCVHFIGMSKDEYWSALRVWGTPDFVHDRATWSCLGEIDGADTVVFGRGAFHTPKKWRRAMTAHEFQERRHS